MMGTLAAVLAGRKIPTGADRYRADVEGDVRDVDGVLRITDVRVRYTLRIRAEQADDARWSLDHYLEKCPAAQSVSGCIRIAHELRLQEE